ncbi:probable cytochrome P450 4aa1 isoform X2 [Homalodisca vitripennis]|nr:probable cytochrome P450 4aa1 isoform X2 [Homalodisca vitripennis]
MVLLLLLSFASILLVLIYLQFRWRYRYILATANKLPCPPGWPLIGNALSLLGDFSRTTKNLFKNFTEFKKHFCLWVGPVPIFVISDPSDVQIILNSSNTLEKDDTAYTILKIFGGNGLVTATVSIWKKTRRLINPVFHPTNLHKFLPVFNDVSRELVQEVDVEGEIFDPSDLFSNAALDAISRTVLTKRPVEKSIRGTIQKGLKNLGELVHESTYKPWLQIEWISKLLGSKLKYTHQLYLEVADYFEKLSKEELCDEEYNKRQKYGYNDSHYKTLLDVFKDNPSVAGDEYDWRDERHTMLGAGTETVTSALSFFSILLANHPDVQEKIYREILQEVEDPSTVTISDLKSLTYLEQSLNECLRLYPSVPAILRKATRNTKLSTFTLPANSRVLIPFYAMGRDEEQFPDPEIFLPDRFSPDASEGRHPYSFLPFSGGPRNCIGKVYAMFFMKTVMVHLLRSYKLHTKVRLCDIEPCINVVMASNTKLLIRFESR